MIKYNPKSWFSLIFQFHKSDTFRQMFWVLVLVAIYTTAIVFIQVNYTHWFGFTSTIAVHSLLGFVIGMLLVFRTNTAYDRWWEGRKQWGALVNNSRNFAMKMNATLPGAELSSRKFFRQMIPNYAYALKEHLRSGVIMEELELSGIDSAEKIRNSDHKPNIIANEIMTNLHGLYKNGVVSGDQLILIDKELKTLTDVLGACERIRNTPIPYSYHMFLKKLIFVYVLTMPFGLVGDFKFWTVPIVTFILYLFGSLELLAEEIEDPFGYDANDLPTDELSGKIRNNVKEIIS